MIKTYPSEKGISPMKKESFAKLATRLHDEGTEHLTANQFDEYLFHAEQLDKNSIKFIENHIAVCERCRSQISAVENNKVFYQALPQID